MENIIFSRPHAAAQRSYAAGRTPAEQVQPAAGAQMQPAEPENLEATGEGVFAAKKLAAAQLARQRAFSAFEEASKTAAPGAAAPKTGLADQLVNAAPKTDLASQLMNAAQAANAAAQADASVQAQSDTIETMKSMLSQANDEAKSLMDMMEEARKKAQETREKLKLPKNGSRYGLAAVEAFARLSRARSQAQVSSAAGYARRQLGQMQTALRQDPDNAGRIRAAIRQLQSAVTRASRKKRELEQDRIDDARSSRAKKEKKPGKAKRIENELRRRQAVRRICDNSYVNNAVIDMVQQEHIEQARAEQRAQLERIAGLGGNSYMDAAQAAYSVAATEAAQAAYTAGAAYAGAASAAAPAAASMPEISLEG